MDYCFCYCVALHTPIEQFCIYWHACRLLCSFIPLPHLPVKLIRWKCSVSFSKTLSINLIETRRSVVFDLVFNHNYWFIFNRFIWSKGIIVMFSLIVIVTAALKVSTFCWALMFYHATCMSVVVCLLYLMLCFSFQCVKTRESSELVKATSCLILVLLMLAITGGRLIFYHSLQLQVVWTLIKSLIYLNRFAVRIYASCGNQWGLNFSDLGDTVSGNSED